MSWQAHSQLHHWSHLTNGFNGQQQFPTSFNEQITNGHYVSINQSDEFHCTASDGSSAAELASIIRRSSRTLTPRKRNLNGTIGQQKSTTVNSRRQHTLRSIGDQNSRSRSPIVVKPDELVLCKQAIDPVRDSLFNLRQMPLDQQPQPPSERSSTNPFKANASLPMNDASLSQVFSAHLMPPGAAVNEDQVGPSSFTLAPSLFSSASFERRRSVYEPARRPEIVYQTCSCSASVNSMRNQVDDLSLDGILSTIQAEQEIMVDSVDGLISKGKQSNEQMELKEFRHVAENDDDNVKINNLMTVETSIGSHRLSDKSLTTSLSSASLSCSETPRARSKDYNAEKRRNEVATGFEIAWLDFTYSVEPNVFEDPRWGKINKLFHKERRMILKGLSGGLKSGQMVALMGPSGAGKTCLLESISGVRTAGIGGRMCLRGRKKAQLVIVPQYDDFMPQFSVEETIIYGSRMKNPFGTNHRQVANTVIEQLGLQVCRSNNIQRCSGGQRKRVAIAQELVSRPNILILDEPTSGLDSSCCYHTLRVLRDVLNQSVQTEQPMAIVSTIHQPSAKVFKMFDLVYLLGKTGYMAYSGPPDELVPTIRDVTGLECPQYSNPSDFMIELVAYDYGEEPVEKLIDFERQKAAQFIRDFEKRAGMSSANQASSSATSTRRLSKADSKQELSNGSTSSSIFQLSTPRLTPSKSDTHLATSKTEQLQQRLKASDLLSGGHVKYTNNITLPLRKATCNTGRRHPFFWHTWVHLHRSFLQSIRDPILNNMRILIHLGFATLLVLLYGKKSGEARGCPPVLGLPTEITDPNNESMIDLADNVGYLFMCIMMITYVSLMSTVLTFPIDIKTVGKEYKNGWYGTVTYFLGKTIADLPFIILYPVVYCLITWYMTNQAQDHLWRYFSFTGLIIMNAMNSQSFGLILGALFVNSVTAATFLGPVITIPWYLFTGFTKRVHRLGEPFKSTSKFLFTRYVFEGILDTVYGHQRCNCSEFLQKYYELRFEEANRLGQLISMETLSSLDYYDGLETIADVYNETLFSSQNKGTSWFERTFDAASTVFADGDDLNLASLMDTNVKASSLFSFGLDFEPTCPSNYENFVVQDFRLGERNVQKAFIIIFAMLVAIRVLTFILVAWKIRTRQL